MSKPPTDSNSRDVAQQLPAAERGFPRSRYFVFFMLAFWGCAVDLLTKQLVFNWLGLPSGRADDNTWWLWEGYVGIQTAVNQGALFGMGQGFSGAFAALSVAAAVGILYWLFYRQAARDLLLTTALGSVTAGIFGNLYDRLGFWHDAEIADRFRYGVRDWILFQYDGHVWPNFNLADSFLVCGAGLLLFHAFFTHDGQPKSEEPKSAAE